mmetsp:Transcript_10393/g.20804  ORF Transcript_10393/g.20804 Transcript_10393/m.20804 type:complete len:248 (-) Transcript_10393:219-962(-)
MRTKSLFATSGWAELKEIRSHVVMPSRISAEGLVQMPRANSVPSGSTSETTAPLPKSPSTASSWATSSGCSCPHRMLSRAAAFTISLPSLSVARFSQRWRLLLRSEAGNSVPTSAPLNTRSMFERSKPLATTVCTPPDAATLAALILAAIPPLPMVDFSPICTARSGVYTLIRCAPASSGGLSYTASTSVRRARASASAPAARMAESLSLSLNTWGPEMPPVTTSFSLMMGMTPMEVRRSSVSVRYT